MTQVELTSSDIDPAGSHDDSPGPLDLASYLRAVAAELSAVPDDERAEMLEEVEAHLVDTLAEEPSSLVAVLGPPAAFAEELLLAAGYQPAPQPGGPLHGMRQRSQAVMALLARTAEGRNVRRARSVLADLAPLWWVVRGYLLASLAGALSRGGHLPDRLPVILGSRALGVVAIIVAVGASVHVGRTNTTRRQALALVALSAVLLIYAVPLTSRLFATTSTVTYIQSDSAASGCLTNGLGQPIGNLYPYDTAGHLLKQVLLYDQTGHPVDNLCPDQTTYLGNGIDTTYAKDVNGAQVVNAFPRVQTFRPASPDETGPPGASTPVPPPAVLIPSLDFSSNAATTPITTGASGAPRASRPATPVPTTAAATG